MKLDVCNALKCLLKLYCLNYDEAAVNGVLSNALIFHDFVLDHLIMLYCANTSLSVISFLLDPMCFADAF